jgi:hypothetical protein
VPKRGQQMKQRSWRSSLNPIKQWKLILPLVAVSLGLVLALAGLPKRSAPPPQPVVAQEPTVERSVPEHREALPSFFAAITVSGTITGPGGPVSDVSIGIGSPQDWQETITDASGSYSLSIQTDDQLWFHIRPDIATSLTQLNYWTDGVTTSFTRSFTVTHGNLLSLQLTGEGGAPVTGDIGLELLPLQTSLPEHYWYSMDWDEVSGRYRAVVPPDIYYVTARGLPAGYYETTKAFDLRATDQSAAMPLNTTYVHPIPYDPPDATKITIGPVDDLGEAVVSGAPGATLPLAHVLLVNLNASHQAYATSETDGSFSARIYAPPGSAVMIKHGPPGFRWHGLKAGVAEGLNPFPGTIINVPFSHTGEAGDLPFAAAGAVHHQFDDDAGTPNYVGAAWAITGTIGPGMPPRPGSAYAPGDLFPITGTVRLYSPAITATTDVNEIDMVGWFHLMMIFNQTGRPMAVPNYFMSTMLTPTGFPIQRIQLPSRDIGGHIHVEDWQYLGGHVVAGSFTATSKLPADWPPGTYRPWIWLDFAGVPTSTEWLAAHVTQFTFGANQAMLPPITVGNVDPPRLIWRLLMDDIVQGTRGTGAREDRGTFELASQIVSQGAPYYTPPVDARTGQTITYRLEPFLPMISFTDRRMPAPPLIPFTLPGGNIRVALQEPDGDVRDLGSEVFTQSFNRTKTTRDGNDLNIGTVQLDDVYSLQTASDRFRVSFDQYGHHLITMTGVISDSWGNSYAGGGTYDLWVAHPLDIDPGVLPGTPLAVGDAFNPATQFYPRVPANVYLTLTLYPNSDPAQAITQTLTGRANPYGYFSATSQSTNLPITLTAPGEYRVDLTAIYTDRSGEIYMGAMTWGGVVMTPDHQADLIAHGRTGLDSLPTMPASHWFVVSETLTIPEGAISHTYNPYFNGDILWSRMSDGAFGGDSLLLGASVHDTVGDTKSAIQSRANRVNPPHAPPGSLNERFSKDEIPLFSSTLSGRPAQTVLGQIGETIPADVDQLAYSYRSSQRPGVRVRELVSADGETGGYWRLDTLYDDQLGVGVQGDQPNDFKFQYVGVVYRDLTTGQNEYLGQGTGWIFIPDTDPTGTRVMPPFAGPGNGGWTTAGGPILTLKGKEIHIFILPTGTRPGAVLQTGDLFRFAGHIMPTLNSSVTVTVTAPSGMSYAVSGQANHVGYFYNPNGDFVVDEPGLWSVDIRVWHDGLCSGGATVPPYPTGDVPGSEDGRFWFYVVPDSAPRLEVSSPSPGFLSFDHEVTPIVITGTMPAGLSAATVEYTISMPGYILAHRMATINGNTYQLTFDPVALQQEFPNLDLLGRDSHKAGLSDTFAIALLLQAQRGGSTIYHANTITIQGQQLFIGDATPRLLRDVFVPLALKGGGSP